MIFSMNARNIKQEQATIVTAGIAVGYTKYKVVSVRHFLLMTPVVRRISVNVVAKERAAIDMPR